MLKKKCHRGMVRSTASDGVRKLSCEKVGQSACEYTTGQRICASAEAAITCDYGGCVIGS
jgi:hypothetical protein